jgi:hypothetical protein
VLFAGPAFSYVVYVYIVMFRDNLLEKEKKDFKDLGEALVHKAQSVGKDGRSGPIQLPGSPRQR